MFLRRIERHNPSLNAFLTVTAEHALAAARRAEKEFARSRRVAATQRPLLGIPITLKDNIWTRGIRTTAGSKILRDFVPAEDATVARKLARAGAILLGKTNMHEFAYGITNQQCALRPGAQSLGARSHFRRIERRLRRRDCGGAVRGVGWHRHRRIDSDSRRDVRDRGAEANIRTRQRIRHRSSGADHSITSARSRAA